MAKITPRDVKTAEQYAAAEERAAKAAERRAKSAQFELDYAEKRHSLSASGITKKEYREQWIMTQRRKEEEEQVTKEKKQQISQDKKSRDLAKDYSKFLKSNTGTLLQQLKIADSDNNMAKAARSFARDAADESLKADKEKNLAAQEAYNAAQDARKEAMVAIEAGEFEGIDYVNDLTSRLENIKGLDSKEFDLLIGGAKAFGDEVDNLIESAGGGEDFARKMEMSKESLNAIDGFEDKIFKVKSFVTDPQFRSTLMKGFFIGLAVTAATKLGEAIKGAYDFAREMGISFKSMPIGVSLAKEEASALLDEFKTLEGVTTANLLNLKMQSYWYGVSATDSAKLLKLQVSTTNATKEMAIQEQSKFMKELVKDGLSANKVIADMAQNTEFMAKFQKSGTKNMEEAAKAAAKMGISLDTMSKITESLLDFESSVNAEMELQAITGRAISLERARTLAHNKDIVGAVEEVKRQMGGEEAFARAGVQQREAMAGAIGLSVAEMAEFNKTQDAAIEEASGLNMYMVALAAVVGGIAGLMISIIPGILASTGIGAPIAAALQATAASTMLTGAAIGAGLGGTAAYAGLSLMSKRERGGPVRAGNPYVVGEKRPELFIPTQSGHILPNVPHMAEGSGATFSGVDGKSMLQELRRSNDLSQKRYEQAEMHSKKNARDLKNSLAPA